MASGKLDCVQQTGSTTCSVALEKEPINLADPALYAPALPGVLIALIGLYVAHLLSRKRERRKELLELCEHLKTTVHETELIVVEAWASAPGTERTSAVRQAKSKLQALGMICTDLRRRTVQGGWRHLKHAFMSNSLSVNVIHEVARLRIAATGDPFEEPDRLADEGRADDVRAICAEVVAKVDQQFHEIYP